MGLELGICCMCMHKDCKATSVRSLLTSRADKKIVTSSSVGSTLVQLLLTLVLDGASHNKGTKVLQTLSF